MLNKYQKATYLFIKLSWKCDTTLCVWELCLFSVKIYKLSKQEMCPYVDTSYYLDISTIIILRHYTHINVNIY